MSEMMSFIEPLVVFLLDILIWLSYVVSSVGYGGIHPIIYLCNLKLLQGCDWRAIMRVTRFFLAKGQIHFL